MVGTQRRHTVVEDVRRAIGARAVVYLETYVHKLDNEAFKRLPVGYGEESKYY